MLRRRTTIELVGGRLLRMTTTMFPLKRHRGCIGTYHQSSFFSTEESSIFRPMKLVPRLESATGRARKRRRKQLQRQRRDAARHTQLVATGDPQAIPDGEHEEEESTVPPQYEPGKPWQVLFPRYHFDPNDKDAQKIDDSSEEGQSRATLGDYWRALPKAWEVYLSSWGIEPKTKNEMAPAIKEEDSGPSLVEETRDNVKENLKFAKKEGQELLDAAKEQTGIHNKEDLKTVASEMLKLATECLKEFMAGYRQGRDKEIDRMLHEYFQEEDDKKEKQEEEGQSPKKRRRRRKRRILLD